LDLKVLKKSDLQLSDDIYTLTEVKKAIALSPSPLGNDMLKISNGTIQIITQPNNGKVTLSATLAVQSSIFTYVSNTADTTQQSFLYKICHSNQCASICDTAKVVLKTALPKDTIPDLACVENSENKFPDLLTPNNDGANDTFDPAAVLKTNGCTELDLAGVQLYFLNRWGETIYVGDINTPWDGRNAKGDLLPVGAYFYSIVVSKGKIFVGVVNLVY
jgi:gliding motility-associated-like protein